ncbi:MAG: peptide chain release factor N(5)-glutamine methyltransferase [Actinomycetota bacterium]|nr:peptide chain release factor N(5)-glutamine methyltransferase [Actinomycetota bacterium]
MRPSEVLHRATGYLEAHDVEHARRTAEILMEEILGTDRAGLYTRTEGLSSAEARRFGRSLCRRCMGTPVQHLTGAQAFRSISLEVRPGVFIPRPETEVLVDVALHSIRDAVQPMVVDVGTGTGAVALSIKAERSDAIVYATDLSPEAVRLARANAQRLDLDVTVLEGDVLESLPLEVSDVALVVSNPPYLTGEELAAAPREVRADPDLALLGATAMHRRLATDAASRLRPGGWLVLEIGEAQAEEVATALEERYVDVSVLRDLAGRDRVVRGRRP